MKGSDVEDVILDANIFAMRGESPSLAFEKQEKRGQADVVTNKKLPKKTQGVKETSYTKEQYEEMGIVVCEESDDLFWKVVLPDGWKIEATDHPMWNNLIDDRGRCRGEFFYKAAIYDRDAFIRFKTRFSIAVDHVGSPDNYDTWKNSDFRGFVKDGETVIFETESVSSSGDYIKDDKIRDRLKKELERYMKAHHPDYKNINAYWE